KIGQDLAARAEARIKAAIEVVAGERKVVASGGIAEPGGDDLSVRLERDPVSHVRTPAAEIGQHLAAGAEARIKAAIEVVAGERKVVASGGIAEPGGDDLSVRLERDPVSPLRTSALEIGQHLAAGAEARIKAAIEVVAGERKVAASGGIA